MLLVLILQSVSLVIVPKELVVPVAQEFLLGSGVIFLPNRQGNCGSRHGHGRGSQDVFESSLHGESAWRSESCGGYSTSQGSQINRWSIIVVVVVILVNQLAGQRVIPHKGYSQ